MTVTNAIPTIVPAATENSSTVNAAGKKELSSDDFIKLFLTQMRHQNPLQPQDSSAILQQMAQISSLTASKDMEKTLNSFQKNFNASLHTSEVLQATQLVGKQVMIPSGVSPLEEKQGLHGSVLLEEPSSKVTVTIADKNGNPVKTIDLGAAASGGLLDFKWDGLKEGGTAYPTDYYKISATATVEGKQISQNTAGSFKVNSVALDPQSGVILNLEGVGGKNMNDIIKIF